MPTFIATISDREETRLSVRLEADSDEPPSFGTDRMFAWQVLAELAALQADRESQREEARRHIRSVTHFVDALRPAHERPNHVFFDEADTGNDEDAFAVEYEIEVYDPALLSGIDPTTQYAVVAFVDEGASPLENDEDPDPPTPPLLERGWSMLLHPDGRAWRGRLTPSGYPQRRTRRASPAWDSARPRGRHRRAHRRWVRATSRSECPRQRAGAVRA